MYTVYKKECQTALYFATVKSRLDVVKVLLAAGADPNAEDDVSFVRSSTQRHIVIYNIMYIAFACEL